MSSSSSTTDHHSVWKPTGCCDCSTDFYEVRKIEWTTHSMGMVGRVAWNTIRTVAAVCTFGLSTRDNGLKDYIHEAVRLFVYCRSCGRNMSLTCELTTSRKDIRWGYYGYYITRRYWKEFEPRLSYNTIKKVFDGMWQRYNIWNKNCFQWANDFYWKICNST